MSILKGTLVSIPLIAVMEIYFRLIQDESAVGWTSLKLATISFLLIFPVLAQTFLFRRSPQTRFLSLLLVSATTWFLFFQFITISAFTRYRGLAKDVEPSLPNFILVFSADFLVLGVPVCLAHSFVVRLLLRRLKWLERT